MNVKHTLFIPTDKKAMMFYQTLNVSVEIYIVNKLYKF